MREETVTASRHGGVARRHRPDPARTTGAALEAHYRFILWLVPAVERFPRNRKFLLGDRIQSTALDVLERLIEATYTRRRYEYAARSLDETGRRVGAWRKGHLGQVTCEPWNDTGNPCPEPMSLTAPSTRVA